MILIQFLYLSFLFLSSLCNLLTFLDKIIPTTKLLPPSSLTTIHFIFSSKSIPGINSWLRQLSLFLILSIALSFFSLLYIFLVVIFLVSRKIYQPVDFSIKYILKVFIWKICLKRIYLVYFNDKLESFRIWFSVGNLWKFWLSVYTFHSFNSFHWFRKLDQCSIYYKL